MNFRVALIPLLMLCSVAHVANADDATSEDYVGIYIKRSAIVVSDLERTLTLWRDVLGMTVDSMSNENKDSLAYDLFNVPKTATLRFATLNAGPQERAFGMLEISGIDIPHQSGEIRRTGIVVNANGRWGEIKASIEEMGLELLRQKTLVTRDHRVGIETGFIDWDGNLIVVYQLPAAKKP
ncbi:MAG: VOC family protein [Pseudomonadota bacterium]